MNRLEQSQHLGVYPNYTEDDAIIQNYFLAWPRLNLPNQKAERMARGEAALAAAQRSGRRTDEATICAHLMTSHYYAKNYASACQYATRCHELMDAFSNRTLFIWVLYFESTIYRTMAPKQPYEQVRSWYDHSLNLGLNALDMLTHTGTHSPRLQGILYFNLAVIYTDHPERNLPQAKNFLNQATECLVRIPDMDDCIRCEMQKARIHLIERQFSQVSDILKVVRPRIRSPNLTLEADHLEVKLHLTMRDSTLALNAAMRGFFRAEELGFEKDKRDFNHVIHSILSFPRALEGLEEKLQPNPDGR